MDLGQQYATITLMLIAGGALGAVHDAYRTSVKEWRLLRRFSVFWDLSFWLFATVFVFTLLLGANHGSVRLIVFLLLGAGWWLYAVTLRRLVVLVTAKIIRAILLVLRFVGRLVEVLVITPLRYLFLFVQALVRQTNHLMEHAEIVIVWPIAWTLMLSSRGIIRLFAKKEDGDEGTNK